MTRAQWFYSIGLLLIGIGLGGASVTYLWKSAIKKEIIVANITVEDTTIYIPVNITVFHPGLKECGPGVLAYTCADGTVIDPQNPIRLAGLSTDLLKIFSYRDSINIIIPQAPYLNNWYQVHTTGKAGITNHVDICIVNPYVCEIKGSWKGFIKTTQKKHHVT